MVESALTSCGRFRTAEQSVLHTLWCTHRSRLANWTDRLYITATTQYGVWALGVGMYMLLALFNAASSKEFEGKQFLKKKIGKLPSPVRQPFSLGGRNRSQASDAYSNEFCFILRREFYYIQMEKYARQAVSEGMKNADDIHVSNDSEIYRVLNLHYNRNNHIEVRLPAPVPFIPLNAFFLHEYHVVYSNHHTP